MSQTAKAQEAVDGGGLASIRRIIADDDASEVAKPAEPPKPTPAPKPAAPPPAAAAPHQKPAPAPPPPAATNSQDDIDAVFAAAVAAPEPEAEAQWRRAASRCPLELTEAMEAEPGLPRPSPYRCHAGRGRRRRNPSRSPNGSRSEGLPTVEQARRQFSTSRPAPSATCRRARPRRSIRHSTPLAQTVLVQNSPHASTTWCARWLRPHAQGVARQPAQHGRAHGTRRDRTRLARARGRAALSRHARA